jgi:hypothetical protein
MNVPGMGALDFLSDVGVAKSFIKRRSGRLLADGIALHPGFD